VTRDVNRRAVVGDSHVKAFAGNIGFVLLGPPPTTRISTGRP